MWVFGGISFGIHRYDIPVVDFKADYDFAWTIFHDAEVEIVEAVDGAGEGRRVIEVTANVAFNVIEFYAFILVVISASAGVSSECDLRCRCWALICQQALRK